MSVRVAILAGAMGLAAVPAAEAAVLSFAFTTPCVSACEAAGMAVDSPFVIAFSVDDASYAPGGAIGPQALQAWDAGFGATAMSVTTAAGAALTGTWGDTPGRLGSVSIQAANRVGAPGGPGFQILYDFGSAGISSGVASLAAFCTAASCDGIDFGGAPAQLRPVTLLTGAPPPIPAPPALLLAASGIAALIGFGRRRRG